MPFRIRALLSRKINLAEADSLANVVYVNLLDQKDSMEPCRPVICLKLANI